MCNLWTVLRPKNQNILRDLYKLLIKTHKISAIKILKLLNQKKFSLVSLVLHDFVDCKASEPDLVDFFVKHCSNLKKMEFENCWDSDWNYFSGPFVDILARIGFKINMDQITFFEEACLFER